MSAKARSLAALLLVLPRLSFAAGIDYTKCRDEQDDKARLACFDAVEQAAEGPKPSYLERHWKLGPGDGRISIDDVQPHQTTYVLVGKWTNQANTQPSSPAPDHSVTEPIPYNNDELSFQLSFKAELVSRHEFGGKVLGLSAVRLWFAYTQRSFWQLYTPRLSRPFRETDYEPEVIATFSTGNQEDGWKLLNVGLVHQSNGRSLPLSRSWNRLYAQGGWEWGRLSLVGRGWWRIPEDPDKNDNPDITDYLGYGDVVGRWQFENDRSVSLLLRQSFKSGRGFAQLDWISRKLFGPARVYIQATSGYGESLIDYNFRQNTIGIGFAYGN